MSRQTTERDQALWLRGRCNLDHRFDYWIRCWNQFALGGMDYHTGVAALTVFAVWSN